MSEPSQQDTGLGKVGDGVDRAVDPVGPDERDPGLGNVLFDVWLLSRATTALVDHALAETELDADEFAIYSVLVPTDGLKPSELAQWMAAPPTTVSSYIARFEARGHLTRIPDPSDGRSYRVALSEDGRQAHRNAGLFFLPLLERVTAGVGHGLAETQDRVNTLRGLVADLRREV